MKKHLHFFQSHFISQMSKKKGKNKIRQKRFLQKKNHHFFSYRLELMRQFYNTAESPEMTIFNFNDKPAAVESSSNVVATPTPTTKVNAVNAIIQKQAENGNGPNNCKNTSRLSLANLLPSRSETRTKLFI